MTPYLFLLPVALCMSLGAYLSYHQNAKSCWWFVYVVAAMSVANGVLWAAACKQTPTPRATMTLSVVYDAITILAYTVLPLCAFGIRLSPAAWVGLAMVVAGSILVKTGG